MNLLNALVKQNIVDQEDVAVIEEEVRSSESAVEYVLAKRGVDSNVVLRAKGEPLNVPSREIGGETIPFEILNYIPEESAKHYQFVPIGVADGVLEVGIINPDNIEVIDALNFISAKINLPFKLFVISQKDFDKVIQMYKGLSGEVGKALTELESELVEEHHLEEKKTEKTEGPPTQSGDTTVIKEDAPVTKMVATILRYAVEGEASDIHIEHIGNAVRVRFRVDGVLKTNIQLPAKVHQAVIARIKILSSMRLDEKRKPQDGRFSATIAGRKIDFRVSTFPAFYGEKVVMRILDASRGLQKLDEMGLSEENIKIIKDAILRPYGLILISGPTGSGKTTTLYAMLNEVDKEEKNVLSLEDPVEYNIPGMNQSQVRPEIGYTFATGLRTTLRQDPDIIMVGEIRDKETAELAIQAALTGHLVLSTIHTNNAVGVVPRLLEMGIDPYLIPPTLIIAMAQRLVKVLCPKSGKQVPVEDSLKIMIDKQFEDLPEKYKKEISEIKYVYEAEPSKNCPNGTKGRIAVFEVMTMSKELEKVILENPTDASIRKVARDAGMITMKEDAILKSSQKIIPFREVNTLGGTFLSVE